MHPLVLGVFERGFGALHSSADKQLAVDSEACGNPQHPVGPLAVLPDFGSGCVFRGAYPVDRRLAGVVFFEQSEHIGPRGDSVFVHGVSFAI
jgi:hypothetical protein